MGGMAFPRSRSLFQLAPQPGPGSPACSGVAVWWMCPGRVGVSSAHKEGGKMCWWWQMPAWPWLMALGMH